MAEQKPTPIPWQQAVAAEIERARRVQAVVAQHRPMITAMVRQVQADEQATRERLRAVFPLEQMTR